MGIAFSKSVLASLDRRGQREEQRRKEFLEAVKQSGSVLCLDASLQACLAEEAASAGISEAEVIQRALSYYFKGE